MGVNSNLKLRTVVPALPCEEGIPDDNKDPRIPGILQALQDMNRMIQALQKQLAIFTGSTVQASLPLTTKGDILTRNTTENKRLGVGTAAQVLTVDSALEMGIGWKDIPYPVYANLEWFYGGGVDGNHTLTGNETLSTDQVIRQYDNLNLDGFTLDISTSNGFLFIFVKNTLNLGSGGKIKAGYIAAAAAGGAVANAASGGNGGRASFSVFVFAKTIIGTGTITAAGEAGPAGGSGSNAAVPGGSQTGGAAGAGVSAESVTMYGGGETTPTAGGGASQIGGRAGGAAAVWSRSQATLSRLKDLIRQIHVSNSTFGPTGERCHHGTSGGAGGSGACAAFGSAGFAAGNGTDGGGGGAGGTGLVGDGGSGGGGGAGSGNDNTGGNSGAGGGGGGGGGFVAVISESAPSTLTVDASGGNGGTGGNGQRGTTGASPTADHGGGGGGGGGGAGIAVLVAQAGCASTVKADAGGGGVAGDSYLGAHATSGTGGAPGYAMKLVR